MEEFKQVWQYLIAIGFLPLAVCMSFAAYGLGRWWYGINDISLKENAVKMGSDEAKALNHALKIIKLMPIIVGICVTGAMTWKPERVTHDYVIAFCLGIAHAFMGVTAYETAVEFKFIQKIEAKFIKVDTGNTNG